MKTFLRTAAVLCVVTAGVPMISAIAAFQQSAGEREEWNRPVEPFRVIGNIYYVGARGVSSFLITTPEGSIVLDGALPETAPQIVKNITALGFKVQDVKFLLNSHAHYDHAGGLQELQKASNAAVVISSGDAPAVRSGAPSMPPVRVDRIVEDGEKVTLGGVTMTANVTPGHTKGCTSWSTTVREGDRSYDVLFYCSTSVVASLVNNPEYPTIVKDYERTFARVKNMKADVFLGAHPMFFGMEEKRKRMSAGGPNPFVDPGELVRYVEGSEEAFRAALAKEKAR